MSDGIELKVTPAGAATVTPAGAPSRVQKAIVSAFASGTAEGMLWLVGEGLHSAVAPGLSFLREIARRYMSELCRADSLDLPIAPPSGEELAFFAMRSPPIMGAEYLSSHVIERWWRELDFLARDLANRQGLKPFLASLNPAWHSIGRVTFHLAENKRDPEYPFAFLATYTQGVNSAGKPVHVPLSRALKEFSGKNDRAALLSLLKPVSDATQASDLAKELLDSGDLYQPLVWTASQAYRFLRDVSAFESSGLMVRVPDWWNGKRAAKRPKVSVTIGDVKKGETMGIDAMLDFDVKLTLDEAALTQDELDELMNSDEPLVQLRGQWVEIDKVKLEEALKHWRKAEYLAREGIDFATGMRMLAGVSSSVGDESKTEPEATAIEWTGIRAGEWLSETLTRLRDPGTQASPAGLRATLRPYQSKGYAWLDFMSELGLGACLADDMGLGKTVQVIALLLKRHAAKGAKAKLPSLLVVPASLIPNWRAELERFAPTLRPLVVHPSEVDPTEPKLIAACDSADVVITTYGMLTRLQWLRDRDWMLAVLDEAQAIKNAGTRQSKSVRELKARARIALSGTPIENRLGDLWSLFEFLNPGLLGSTKSFGKLCKTLAENESGTGFAPLRSLVKPYILRRLKTDKTVINDLPDKTELKAYCTLTPAQAKMYQQSVDELARVLETTDQDIQRRGIVLAYLMRFKQICNHPAQVLGDGAAFESDQSGKYERLREICGELIERQERVLVFTQFREMTAPLAEELSRIFGREGLVLSGSTSVPQRKKMVDAFQRDDGPPFFVLSIKAGGTGLNLTAASNVIHFDRWWNPAVENQATDRAFRIGQKRNVLVHKFVCRGTIEEKIDAMIESKSALADELLADGSAEKMLTEMSDDELIKFVSLDVRAATGAE